MSYMPSSPLLCFPNCLPTESLPGKVVSTSPPNPRSLLRLCFPFKIANISYLEIRDRSAIPFPLSFHPEPHTHEGPAKVRTSQAQDNVKQDMSHYGAQGHRTSARTPPQRVFRQDSRAQEGLKLQSVKTSAPEATCGSRPAAQAGDGQAP